MYPVLNILFMHISQLKKDHARRYLLPIGMLFLAACASATPASEVPAAPADSIGTINRVSDMVQHNQSPVSTPENLLQNDSLRMLNGGEGLLDFGSDMRLRMFNDTEIGGVRTANEPGSPLIVKMTLFSGGFTGQMFREGGEAEFDTPNGAQIRVFGTTFVLVYDRDSRVTLCGNFEGDMQVEAAGSELISIPSGIIYAVRPGEEPEMWGEIPWTPVEYEVQARSGQSPLAPFGSVPRTGDESTVTPTETYTPVSPTIEPTTPAPSITFTPTPTNTPTPADSQPPVIEVIYYDPISLSIGIECPDAPDTVQVTASVSDDSEIGGMIAYWEIGGQGKEVSMERVDDQTYTATIGPVNSTGELFIEIRGEDVMGNAGKSKPVNITVSKCIG